MDAFQTPSPVFMKTLQDSHLMDEKNQELK